MSAAQDAINLAGNWKKGEVRYYGGTRSSDTDSISQNMPVLPGTASQFHSDSYIHIHYQILGLFHRRRRVKRSGGVSLPHKPASAFLRWINRALLKWDLSDFISEFWILVYQAVDRLYRVWRWSGSLVIVFELLTTATGIGRFHVLFSWNQSHW